MFVSADDLDSGYWHLALHPDSYQYCGNSCLNLETGKRHYFQWKVLFLGITSAVTVFTRITTPIKIYLRLHCRLLIDDILLGAKSFDECLYLKFVIINVLGRAG